MFRRFAIDCLDGLRQLWRVAVPPAPDQHTGEQSVTVWPKSPPACGDILILHVCNCGHTIRWVVDDPGVMRVCGLCFTQPISYTYARVDI